MKKSLVLIVFLFPLSLLAQQIKDSAKTISLKEIIVNGIKTVRGTGHMPEMKDGIIYAGKKMRLSL
jgi:Fe(3+) dicitrate transport protein